MRFTMMVLNTLARNSTEVAKAIISCMNNNIIFLYFNILTRQKDSYNLPMFHVTERIMIQMMWIFRL